jgi:hypothetical protein
MFFNNEFRLVMHDLEHYAKRYGTYGYHGMILKHDERFVVAMERNYKDRNFGTKLNWMFFQYVPVLKLPRLCVSPVSALVIYNETLNKLKSAMKYRPDMYQPYDYSRKEQQKTRRSVRVHDRHG